MVIFTTIHERAGSTRYTSHSVGSESLVRSDISHIRRAISLVRPRISPPPTQPSPARQLLTTMPAAYHPSTGEARHPVADLLRLGRRSMVCGGPFRSACHRTRPPPPDIEAPSTTHPPVRSGGMHNPPGRRHIRHPLGRTACSSLPEHEHGPDRRRFTASYPAANRHRPATHACSVGYVNSFKLAPGTAYRRTARNLRGRTQTRLVRGRARTGLRSRPRIQFSRRHRDLPAAVTPVRPCETDRCRARNRYWRAARNSRGSAKTRVSLAVVTGWTSA